MRFNARFPVTWAIAILCVICASGCQSERKTTLIHVGTSVYATDVWWHNPPHPLVFVSLDPKREVAIGTELIAKVTDGDAVMTVEHLMNDMAACRLQRGGYPVPGTAFYRSEGVK